MVFLESGVGVQTSTHIFVIKFLQTIEAEIIRDVHARPFMETYNGSERVVDLRRILLKQTS